MNFMPALSSAGSGALALLAASFHRRGQVSPLVPPTHAGPLSLALIPTAALGSNIQNGTQIYHTAIGYFLR